MIGEFQLHDRIIAEEKKLVAYRDCELNIILMEKYELASCT